MTAPQRRFWDLIRVAPAKWKQRPYGEEGGGFWVAAVIGELVVWCNDIEDGFNLSRYPRHGTIGEYGANQDQLEWAVEGLLARFETGAPPFPGTRQPGPG